MRPCSLVIIDLTCIIDLTYSNYELQTEIFCEAAHLEFCVTSLEMSTCSWAGFQFALISLQLVENLTVLYLAEKYTSVDIYSQAFIAG